MLNNHPGFYVSSIYYYNFYKLLHLLLSEIPSLFCLISAAIVRNNQDWCISAFAFG